MIKDIKYNGYSANPSDYESADGDLALSLGLINENGALNPVYQPHVVLSLSDDSSILHVHETVNFRHYIISKAVTNDLSLHWWNGKGSQYTFLKSYKSATIHQVASVGNTLIVLYSGGMDYFLWKADSNKYLSLGSNIPHLPLSFGLQGEVIKGDKFDISFDKISKDNLWNEFSDDNKTKISAQVLAKVNKFIADNSTNKGKFLYPFLLRYAYRLYDGSLTKHSAPILMVASSDLAPQVAWTNISGEGNDATNATLEIFGVLHSLDYAIPESSTGTLHELNNWSDIVSSIDIFISRPIYTYDQNGECTNFVKVDNSDSYSICLHANQKASITTYPLKYQLNTLSKLYACTFNADKLPTQSYPISRLMIPRRSVEDVKAEIGSCAQFYFLESIKLDQLSTSRTIINVEEDYLQSLVTREVMTDDYDSHDKLFPQYAFVYNSRLNICNNKKLLFSGYHANAMFPYSNGYVFPWSNAPATANDYTLSVQIFIHIKQDGNDIIVKAPAGSIGNQAPILFIYYPNINAYKATIVRTQLTSSTTHEVPLTKHDFLNGAFYFGGWNDLNKTVTSAPAESSDAQRTVDIPNKIYTSEVNNPFHFPLLGINTVGTGKIYGICAAAKALSEGQFGQFPLYAFTSEGVWALEISATGSYSAKQPITRDVCINPDSITQIDSAVLFATDRGIMLISGSTVQCISDTICAPDIFNINDLSNAGALVDIFNSIAPQRQQIATTDIAILPFLNFLSNCRMIYDYVNQHIIVYNPGVRYAYVFSLKSKLWGMIYSDIVNNVNSYPEALAMNSKAQLVDFSKSDDVSVAALAISRPIFIDNPDSFKTINTIIQRGMFRSNHIKQVLYGSNDLINWHTVWSSADKFMRGFRGSPFKVYRIAIIGNLLKGESIYGCSIDFNLRLNNQLR